MGNTPSTEGLDVGDANYHPQLLLNPGSKFLLNYGNDDTVLTLQSGFPRIIRGGPSKGQFKFSDNRFR